jgi:ParB-like chromosome segregation protein Spo0J
MTEPLLLETHLLPISVLFKHPRNYKKHPETQLHKLRESLKRFGQTKPVLVIRSHDTIVDFPPLISKLVIVAGHGIVEAARQLGWVDVLVAIAPEHWTPEDALAYLVADNETSRDAEVNELMLAELLEESKNAGYDLAALGSSEEQLAALLEKLAQEQLAQDYTTEPLPDLDEIGDDENPLDAQGITCPNCGHTF